MEIYEIFQFLQLGLAMAIPFGTIYLLLGAVNWDRKRNLLSTSFCVFFCWAVSSAVGAVLLGFVGFILRIEGRLPFLALLFLGMLTINTCAVAAILWWRKVNRENLSILGEDSLENPRPSNDRIWRTALLVSCLTLLVTVGFLVARSDIEKKLCGGQNNASFWKCY